jgi:hypothetical protein
MRIEPLLLWSLNAALPDGGVGIDRPDRISCRLTTDNASSGACVPEGFVVWLGRYVVPERHESLEALCGRYKCTAGVKVFFVCCVSCLFGFSGTLLLLNAWLKSFDASAFLLPLNSSKVCGSCSAWELRAPARASQTTWVGPAADALMSGNAAGAVCVLPA